MEISRIVGMGCLLACAASAAEAPRVRIRVQDYAGVSHERRVEAFDIAAAILQEAGVASVWLNCSPNQAEPMDSACSQKPGPLDVVLRLMPEKMARATGLKTACLGFAVIPVDDFGALAAVFVDEARSKAERALASRSAVLGHAIAHEVAHLLIGRAGHASRGLMQAVWSRRELLRATAFPMKLLDSEEAAIAANLLRRAERAQSLDSN